MNQTSKLSLEQIVDAHGVQQVLEAVAEMCIEKGEHVRVSYGDALLARLWERAGEAIERCSGHASVLALADVEGR